MRKTRVFLSLPEQVRTAVCVSACAIIATMGSPAWGLQGADATGGQTFSLHWTDVPLRSGLQGIVESAGRSLLLDRRLDPDRKVSIELHDATLQQAVSAVARSVGGDASFFDGIVYVGPKPAALRCRTLLELRRRDWESLPPDIRARGNTLVSGGWERLAVPREVVSRWLTQASLRAEGLDRFPHDLLAPADLPQMPLHRALALFAGMFELTYVPQADGVVQFLPVGDDVVDVRRFQIGVGAAEAASRVKQAVPDVRVQVEGTQLIVEGRIESLELAASLLQGAAHGTQPSGGRTPVRPRPGSDPYALDRFTVKEAKATLRQVIEQFGRQLRLDIRYDEKALEQAGVSLDRPIVFQVENGTIDDLWHAVLDPLGCRFERRGRIVQIMPK
ncbi:MAG: hypothetical protein D6741_14955 [Planctomycetota bacterium]|nr:MAG: hypothetical protein D6741_14955 [Planctomycetota bacterium]